MFDYEDNKYATVYFQIVAKARARPTPSSHWRKRALNDNYYEKHHIWPTSLGGPDIEDNWVFLTAKEHFVCHLLLTRMVTGEALRKMQYALSFMLVGPEADNGSRYIPTGRTFEIARKAAADAMRGNAEVAAKISAAHMGKVLSEEHKAKISASGKAREFSPSDDHRNAISKAHKGKPKSEEAKAKMKAAWVARRERIKNGEEVRVITDEGRAKLRASKPKSEETRKNMSDAAKARKASDETRKKLSEAQTKRWAAMKKIKTVES